MAGKKVVVAGHACLDITPVFPAKTVCSQVGDVLSPGRLVQMEGVEIHAGGVVSNTGLAMKLLGADVQLAAKVGEDAFGSILRDIYARRGVSGGVLVAPGEATSYSVVLAVPGIDRIFLHNPGCNDTFSLEDVRQIDLDNTVLFHFGYPPLMKKMYRSNGDELLEILRYVKSRGAATSLDLAFVDETSEAGKADWKAILTRILPYVDFFVPSIEELCWMLDRPRYEQWKKRAGNTEMVRVLDPERDVKPLADLCLALGARVLLLKCGSPGLYYRTGGKEQLQALARTTGLDAEDWADQDGFEKSFRAARVLSGTGAGDTTIAAFLAAMLQGEPFRLCVQLAAAEGTSCVEAYDALGGLHPLSELKRRIEAGWPRSDADRE